MSCCPDFLNSDIQAMLIKGYAGTGKTFIIKQIACMLSDLKIPFSLMAPTGRAAKVLTSKSGIKSYTIHKSIYNIEHMTEINKGEASGEESFLYYFKIRNNEENLNHVYIVDEASMVSDNYSAGEFFRFGSGKLLSDLISYIDIRNFRSRKIIFVGDNAQLPPVNSSFSPALSMEYLLDNFGISSFEYELTDVVRHDKYSAILSNAFRIRDSIKKRTFNEIYIGTSEEEIISSSKGKVVADYFDCLKASTQEETIIIAYSNKTVSEYNEMIRSQLFPGKKSIQKGDCIIVVSNNYNKKIEILNGETGIVESLSDHAVVRRIPIIKDEKKQYVEIAFRDAVISFKDMNNNRIEVNSKIIENLLYSAEPDLNSDELKAMYIDFKIRNNHLRAGTKDFREALKTDPYFNALRVKFGYAITCHKAQGGEWKNVIVDFHTNSGKLNENYFRWTYTALTRSKGLLFVINPPGYNAFTYTSEIEKIDRSGLGVFSIVNNSRSVNDIPDKFGFNGKPQFLRAFYSAVDSICNNYTSNIHNLEHYEYCERYFISKDKNFFCINLWYNKDGKVKRIEPLVSKSRIEDKSLYEKILNGLYTIQGKFIAAKAQTDKLISFPEERPWLKSIYENLSDCLGQFEISVDRIEHLNWRERYYLSKDINIVQIDMTYNSKGIVTNIQPDVNKSSSAELLNEISQAISLLQKK